MLRQSLTILCLTGACVSVGCGQDPSATAVFGRATSGSQSDAWETEGAASPKTLADAPSTLRAAVIAAAQRDAGEAHAVRADAGLLRANARGFSVRYDARGAHLERSLSDPVAPTAANEAEGARLSLHRVGCAGTTDDVSEATPTFSGNRVAYARQGNGVAVEEWYLTGPMGLEQGFTIADQPACTAAGAELVLEVMVEALAVRADGESLVLAGKHGERYRYSDLFATDANGKALATRIGASSDGRISLGIDVKGASFPVEVDPLLWTEEAKLAAGGPVALSGDTALVGVPNDSSLASDAGSAYVFVRLGSTWTQQQKLVASDTAAIDLFGNSVALSGDTALVGAYLDDDNGQDSGSVYVFLRSGNTWTQVQKLVASDGATGDVFGKSIALSGNTTLVGASGDDDNGAESGGAYVFVRSSNTWTQQQKILAPDGATMDLFGESVALSGDTALVGAPDDDDKGDLSGGAYVFVRSGNTWTQQQKLLASDSAQYDQFGRAVALSGDTALVSGYRGAYVFVRSSATWSQQQKLHDTVAGFGSSVAVNGDKAIIGAMYDHSKASNAGSVYAYVRTGTAWSQHQKLFASNAGPLHRFGSYVALSGNDALVGAVLSGSYVFTLKKADGDPCGAGSECASGYCTDGVCCDTACGGGTSDCQACSVVAGTAVDGTCGPSTGNGCNDGNGCTQTDICQSGSCTGGNPVTCPALNQCHDAACDPKTGTCSSSAKTDGMACTDNNACTLADTCQSGACTGGSPVLCAALSQCHDVGTCDSITGTCTSPTKADGTPCTSGTCQGGSCVPTGTGGTAGGAGAGGSSTAGTAGTSTGGAGGSASGGTAGAAASGSASASSGGSSPTGGAGGSSGNGTGGDTASSPAEDSGCGCRTAGHKGGRNDGGWLLLLLGVVSLFGTRRLDTRGNCPRFEHPT